MSMRTGFHLSNVAMAALVILSPALSPALRAQDDPLSHLGAGARATIERLLDSARADGLPRAPLIDKVAEGVLKGAADDRIVRAVQSLWRDLAAARLALGADADPAVLSAAASALHAGVSSTELRRMANPPPPGVRPEPASLATALVTLVDLVAKRVPVTLATSSIQELMDRHAGERELSALRNDVDRDILAGQTPEASLAERVRAQTRTNPP